jgi:hypothetical protein
MSTRLRIVDDQTKVDLLLNSCANDLKILHSQLLHMNTQTTIPGFQGNKVIFKDGKSLFYRRYSGESELYLREKPSQVCAPFRDPITIKMLREIENLDIGRAAKLLDSEYSDFRYYEDMTWDGFLDILGRYAIDVENREFQHLDRYIKLYDIFNFIFPYLHSETVLYNLHAYQIHFYTVSISLMNNLRKTLYIPTITECTVEVAERITNSL